MIKTKISKSIFREYDIRGIINETLFEDTAYLIAEILDTDFEFEMELLRTRPKLSEVHRLFGDNTKIKKLTDWSPAFSGKVGFRLGLEKTIDWHISHYGAVYSDSTEYKV